MGRWFHVQKVTNPNSWVSFKTTRVGTDTYQIRRSVNTAHFYIDWGDGSAIEFYNTTVGNTAPNVSHTYAMSGEKTVVVTFVDITQFTGFNFAATKLVTHVDIQNAVSLNYFAALGTQLHTVIMPSALANNTAITTFNVYGTSLTSLDLSNVTFSSSFIFQIYNTPLSDITWPTSMGSWGSINNFYADNTELVEIDLSGFEFLSSGATTTGANVRLNSNNYLENVILKSTPYTGRLAAFSVANCPVLEHVDLSKFTTLITGTSGASISLANSAMLSTVDYPTSIVSGVLGTFYCQNCIALKVIDISAYTTLRMGTNSGALIDFFGCTVLEELVTASTPVTGNIFRLSGHTTPSLNQDIDLTNYNWPTDPTNNGCLLYNSAITGVFLKTDTSADDIIYNFQVQNNPNLIGTLNYPLKTRNQVNISQTGITELNFTNDSDELELRSINISMNGMDGISGVLDLSKIKNGYGSTVSPTYGVVPFIVTINYNLNLTDVVFHPDFNHAHGASFQMQRNNLTGILDLSMFEYLVDPFIFGATNNHTNNGNPNLNNFIFSPTVQWDVAKFTIDWCDIQPTLDLSSMRTFGKYNNSTQQFYYLNNNENLEEIIYPDSSEPNDFSSLNFSFSGQPYNVNFSNMKKLVSLNLETYEGAGNLGIQNCDLLESITLFKEPSQNSIDNKSNGDTRITVSGCPVLEEIIFPAGCTRLANMSINAPISLLQLPSSQDAPIVLINLNNTLLTEIDLSVFTSFSQNGGRSFVNNTVCTEAKIPMDVSFNTSFAGCSSLVSFELTVLQKTTIDTFGDINFTACILDATSVDRLLEEIDAIVVGAQTTGTRRILLPSAAAPTDGSVTGYDGLAAKASLIAKGITVDTN